MKLDCEHYLSEGICDVDKDAEKEESVIIARNSIFQKIEDILTNTKRKLRINVHLL